MRQTLCLNPAACQTLSQFCCPSDALSESRSVSDSVPVLLSVRRSVWIPQRLRLCPSSVVLQTFCLDPAASQTLCQFCCPSDALSESRSVSDSVPVLLSVRRSVWISQRLSSSRPGRQYPSRRCFGDRPRRPSAGQQPPLAAALAAALARQFKGNCSPSPTCDFI